MIPIESLWIALILSFGTVGSTRGLRKELGVTTVLSLSLFTLDLLENKILDALSSVLPTGFLSDLPDGSIAAIYYSAIMVFVAFISYEGISLQFPIQEAKGLIKSVLGLLGGLLNGYLIVGTIWDVVHRAQYFGIEVALASSGTKIAISEYLTPFHNTIVEYLPVSLMDKTSPIVILALGMILLLAIILK
jgi:hypothetical protein